MAVARKGLPLPLSIALFSIAVTVAVALVLGFFEYAFSLVYVAEVAFFAVVTWGLLNWQESSMHTDPKGFVRRFMLGLTLKMLGCLIAMTVLAFLAPPGLAVPWILCFALLYLVFLVFSVARLMRRSKQPHGPSAAH